MENGSSSRDFGLIRKSYLEYCDVGLGLKMQQPTATESSSLSYPCKRTMFMLPPTTQHPSSWGTSVFNGYDEHGITTTGAGGPSLNDLYDPFKFSGVFTASQRQEFERQAMIYKFMMASVPVPSQLLLPLSQSTTSVTDLRFSNSTTDREPWRCRRTDGKKWRCSRNATPPGQKYCERHAHKSKARSRKPVEIHQSHQPNISTNNNYSTTTTTSSSQTRGIELFTRGGLSNHQWQNPFHSSSAMEISRQNLELNKEANCNFQLQQRDNNNLASNQEWENRYYNSNLDPKMVFMNANTTHTTRHFIDAMSTTEKRGLDSVCKKECVNSSSRKLPFSSLTLSMPGGNEIDENHEKNSDTDTTGMMMMMGFARNGQWMMNPVTRMDTTPGGPLGEALCLGMSSGAKGGSGSGLPSPHGYSNSTTTTSSCSRSSCEDGSQAHNFIG